MSLITAVGNEQILRGRARWQPQPHEIPAGTAVGGSVRNRWAQGHRPPQADDRVRPASRLPERRLIGRTGQAVPADMGSGGGPG
ncbi:hypothetical protein AY599_09095 [Leptolyngbya valderiana BDU 20041]|nr:hypothetical protein AY599_09095 [Leptolyngbya valderiana BDU 20041]